MTTDSAIARDLHRLSILSEREEAAQERVGRAYINQDGSYRWYEPVSKGETLLDRALDTGTMPALGVADYDDVCFNDKALVVAARNDDFREWLEASAALVVEELVNLEIAR